MSLILGIETSCDETAAAIVDATMQVRSNVVASQHELHERYSGVVPELASRAHLERLVPVVQSALEEASVGWDDLDAVAVGHAPGLIGSLLVGVSAAKALAWSLGIDLIGVHHVLAHLHAAELNAEPVPLPAIGLVASGGHTHVYHFDEHWRGTLLASTIDDAIGEAFDKAGTMLRAGYPGGPAVEAMAQSGDPLSHELPIGRPKVVGSPSAGSRRPCCTPCGGSLDA